MSDEDKDEILKALEGTEKRLGSKIDGMRQHRDVNLDAIASDAQATRRVVEWLKDKWQKFTRSTD